MIPLKELHIIHKAFVRLFVSFTADVTQDEKEAGLRDTAAKAFRQCFAPHDFHPEDMLLTYEHTEDDQEGLVIYRAQWDPTFTEIELRGGSQDGLVMHHPFPNSTVTTSSGVGGLHHYHLVGFNTDTRRYIFALERAGQPAQ